MTAETMPPARRRPIPGITPAPPAQPPNETEREASLPSFSAAAAPANASAGSRRRARSSVRASAAPNGATHEGEAVSESSARERRPAADYAATRLANFRLPVDLHDRFKDLVREAERRHPRVRHLSLTEVIVALLEEGPGTPEEIAELIRRKRADEHSA